MFVHEGRHRAGGAWTEMMTARLTFFDAHVK
jgi:hypothetical protein